MNSEKRLPCRGCLPSCKNFSICHGKPWRNLPAQNSEAKKDASKSNKTPVKS